MTGHDTTLKNGRFCVQFCLFHIYPHKEDVRERTFPLIFAEKMAAPAQPVTTSDIVTSAELESQYMSHYYVFNLQ